MNQQSCQSNPDKSYTERKAIHEPCGYSLDLALSFDVKENKQIVFTEANIIKKFCKELNEICTRIVNYEQKEMTPLTDKEKKYYEEQKKNATYIKKGFTTTKKNKKFINYIIKLEIIVILWGNLEELPTVFVI